MRIVFQTDTGKKFQADLIDDKLKNIQPLSDEGTPSGSSSSSSASSATSEQNNSDSEQDEPLENNKQSGGSKPLSPEDRVFIEQLQAVLVNNRARKQLRNKQKGSLDLKALVRTQTNSQSVFKQNNRKDSERNYSVVLLVDQSSSMAGAKSALAQELTSSISHSLDKVGGVETAVLGFSNNRIVEHKRFDNTGYNSVGCIDALTAGYGSHECQICNRIQSIARNRGSNSDFIAMEYALDYLISNQAPNSRPIFVMLSDGLPCSSYTTIEVITSALQSNTFRSKFVGNGFDTKDINNMHKLIARYPGVNSFGLGMLEGGQQVPKHKVVKDIKQTKNVLLEFLRTAIN